MKLGELKSIIDHAHLHNPICLDDEVRVIIDKPDSGLRGPTPSVNVLSVVSGFDWDNGSFLIKTDAVLVNERSQKYWDAMEFLAGTEDREVERMVESSKNMKKRNQKK